ncbi:MAG: beta-lactamase family protein [Acetobacteraceae bacterium]|nr:beta-lactamase family protein [Acetobacteraceae bacterium]
MRDLDLLRLERRVGLMLAPLAEGPGAAVGVARDGALLLRRAAGLASIELGVPIGPATTFRIASVSKHFTCAAILLLAQEGRVSPQDPFGRHLPGLPPALASITLDQAMRNASGIRDMFQLLALGGTDLSQPVTEAELDAAIRRSGELNFASGTRFLYSNAGFRLLGQVVEAVSGQAFDTFLQRRLFSPLGMTRTRHTPDLTTPVPGLATGYLPDGQGGFRRAPHGFPLGGEGGLVSGVEDLALWARNLSLGLLGNGLEDQLERTAPFANGVTNRYALGLEVEAWRGVRTVSHGGLWPGYKTAFLRIPERRITVIVIANNGGLDPHHMALQVMEAALEGELAPPPPAVEAAPLAGSWIEASQGLSLDIRLDDAGQATGVMHGVPFALIPAPDGWLTARRNAFPLRVAASGDALRVEQDAGVISTWHRAAPGPLPAGLDGTWRCEALGTTWRIADGQVEVEGPIRRAGPWAVEAVAPRQLRVHIPSTLWNGWADAVLEGDTLTVNAARARGLVFRR